MSNSFHYLVMAEHSIFQKRLLAKLKGTGLTSGQPKVLDYLKDHDGASQKDIAHGCHIEPGTLTTLLNRMEELGLVERRMLRGNRRSYYVFMTDLGKSKLMNWRRKLSAVFLQKTERTLWICSRRFIKTQLHYNRIGIISPFANT